jgi:hypothetical protein
MNGCISVFPEHASHDWALETVLCGRDVNCNWTRVSAEPTSGEVPGDHTVNAIATRGECLRTPHGPVRIN